jgi:hypothetical protein
MKCPSTDAVGFEQAETLLHPYFPQLFIGVFQRFRAGGFHADVHFETAGAASCAAISSSTVGSSSKPNDIKLFGNQLSGTFQNEIALIGEGVVAKTEQVHAQTADGLQSATTLVGLRRRTVRPQTALLAQKCIERTTAPGTTDR